jgi:hypothetical protein
MRLGVKKLTLVAALAAVYAVVSYLLPSFPMIGVPGRNITTARSLEMGYGFILGPTLGPLAAFLGDVTGKLLIQPANTPFALLAPVSAFVAAAVSRRTVFRMRGWVLAAAVSTIFILGWYITPVGREAFYYPLPHLVGLGILFVGRGTLAKYVNSVDKKKVTVGVAFCSFSSTMTGHMAGNLLFMAFFPGIATPIYFLSTLPVAVVERITITFIGELIAAPLIFTMRVVFPDLVRETS